MKIASAMMLSLVLFALPFASNAAPMYATNVAYFDNSGNLVGQKIQWCNNRRFSQGNVNSPYQRHDWSPCSMSTDPYGGYVCRGGGATFECNWVQNVVPPHGGIAVEGGNLLPAGMTVADSCAITGDCAPQPPEPLVYPHVQP